MNPPGVVSPIGFWLTTLDGAILTGMDNALQGIFPLWWGLSARCAC
jgi:hypothetical protein